MQIRYRWDFLRESQLRKNRGIVAGVIIVVITGIGLYDLGVSQLAENPEKWPRTNDIVGWLPAYGWAILVFTIVVIALFEGGFQAARKRDKISEELKSKEPVLEIQGPFSRQAEVDTIQLPLWHVIVKNTQPRSVAKNVSVRMNNPRPGIITSFPIDLHRMHDNDKPFKKRHDIRFGEPITFDLFACGQVGPEMYYLYRADGDEISQAGPEWMLSDADNVIISSAVHDVDGWRIDVVAVPDPPATPACIYLSVKCNSDANWPYLEAFHD